jgi:hypothetical protein
MSHITYNTTYNTTCIPPYIPLTEIDSGIMIGYLFGGMMCIILTYIYMKLMCLLSKHVNNVFAKICIMMLMYIITIVIVIGVANISVNIAITYKKIEF